MYSLNKVQVIGNLTRDPEVRQIPSGQMVCTIGVATNRVWKNQNGEKQEQVEYHNIVCWGRLAEIAGQYLKKGNRFDHHPSTCAGDRCLYPGCVIRLAGFDPDHQENYPFPRSSYDRYIP